MRRIPPRELTRQSLRGTLATRALSVGLVAMPRGRHADGMRREVHALMVEFTRGDRSACVVVWPGDLPEPQCARPEHGWDWLDVGVGDAVLCEGQRWRVSQVLLYRSSPIVTPTVPIRTGRDWLATGRHWGVGVTEYGWPTDP
jgi:hypothetical protein